MSSSIKSAIIICILFAITGFALLYKLGDLPFAEPDEPRYAESAREMIELGSYMVPYLNYEPRLEKPVLHYLLICASYALLGVSEFSARLPSVLAALLLLGMTFFVVRRFCGIGTAALACLMMVSSPLYFVNARLTMPDMVFSCVIIVSLFCFYLGWQAAVAGAKRRWYIGFFLFQIIAAWIKGPVGILVPVAVALLCLWQQRDLHELKRMRLGRALVIVLLASLPWYAYVYFFVDRAPLAGRWQQQTLGKLLGWSYEDFGRLYYYVLVLLLGLLPWSLLMPWALYRRFRTLEKDRFRQFLEVWFLFVFLLFTACASKKPQYVIMLVCVCSAWLGSVAIAALRAAAGRRDRGLIVSLCAFLAVVAIGALWGLSWLAENQPDLLWSGKMAAVTLVVPALLAVCLAARGQGRSALVALSMATLLSIVPAVNCAGDWLNEHRSVKAFLLENNAAIQQAREIYTGVKTFTGLSFYLRRKVIMNPDKKFLAQKLQGAEPCVVFISEKRYQQNKELLAPYLMEAKYGKVLLSNFAAQKAGP